MTFQKNNAHDAPSAARYHKAEVRNGAAQIVVIDGSKLEGNAKIVRIEGNEWHTQSKYFASRTATF